jgi:hypothetical protein
LGPKTQGLCLEIGFATMQPRPRLPFATGGFIIVHGESIGTPMIKFFCCRRCRVAVEPIVLADGTAALVCIDCDLIGLAHEVSEGGPVWAAGARHLRKRTRQAPINRTSADNFSEPDNVS